tara:strand:- start:3267 stop:4094 length:828 start_codon:yes stop_codon:yes gene_type:complete
MKPRNYLYLLLTIFLFSSFLELNASVFEAKKNFQFSSGFSRNIKFQKIGFNNNSYLTLLSGFFILFLNNLVLYFYIRSKSYLIYIGVIIFWTFSSFFWFSEININLSKVVFSLSILITSILYFYFIKDLFDFREKSLSLNNFSNYLIYSLGSFLLISPFLTKYSIHMLYLCIFFICFFISLIFFQKKKFNNLKILIHAFSFLIIGLFSSFLFDVELIFAGVTIHFLILGMAPLNKIKIGMEHELKEEKDLSNLLEDVRYGLEKVLKKEQKRLKTY